MITAFPLDVLEISVTIVTVSDKLNYNNKNYCIG